MEARMLQLETEAEALLQSKGQNKQSESEQASSIREAQTQLALLKAANDTLTTEVKRLTELARSKDDIIQKKHEEALHARIDERRKTIYGMSCSFGAVFFVDVPIGKYNSRFLACPPSPDLSRCATAQLASGGAGGRGDLPCSVRLRSHR